MACPKVRKRDPSRLVDFHSPLKFSKLLFRPLEGQKQAPGVFPGIPNRMPPHTTTNLEIQLLKALDVLRREPACAPFRAPMVSFSVVCHFVLHSLPRMKAQPLVFLAVAALPTVLLRGTVHEIGPAPQKVVARYTMSRVPSAPGTVKTSHQFVDPQSGQLLVEETITQDQAGQVLEFTQDHRQIQGQGVLTATPTELNFRWTKDGKSSSDQEARTPDFLVPPQFPDVIRDRWGKLTSGETTKIRLAVLDRKETVGFRIDFQGEETWQGKSVSVFRLKPTSFVIQAIVDPVFLSFDPKTKQLLRVLGRVPIKQLQDGKLRDFDGDTTYEVPN